MGEDGGERVITESDASIEIPPGRNILMGTKGAACGDRVLFIDLRSSAEVGSSFEIDKTFLIGEGELVAMIGLLGTKTSASGDRINVSLVKICSGSDSEWNV